MYGDRCVVGIRVLAQLGDILRYVPSLFRMLGKLHVWGTFRGAGGFFP